MAGPGSKGAQAPQAPRNPTARNTQGPEEHPCQIVREPSSAWWAADGVSAVGPGMKSWW